MNSEQWIDRYGSPNEKGRFKAGFLSEEGLDTVVYRALWDAFAGRFFKRQRWSHADVEAVAVGRGKAQPGEEVRFETVERADALTEAEWDTYCAIEEAAKPFGATLKPFWIFAYCGAAKLKKSYVQVIVQVDERELKVELCLDAHDVRPDEPTLPRSYVKRPAPTPEVYKKRERT